MELYIDLSVFQSIMVYAKFDESDIEGNAFRTGVAICYLESEREREREREIVREIGVSIVESGGFSKSTLKMRQGSMDSIHWTPLARRATC